MLFLLNVSTNIEQTSMLNKVLTPDTLCTFVTVIGSVITVSITYFKTQKMKQFDIFFSRKADAYESFWTAMSNYYDHQTEENRRALRYAVHRIGLYASEDIFSQISKLSTLLLKGSRDISDYIVEISTLMRKDLKSTKRGKLY